MLNSLTAVPAQWRMHGRGPEGPVLHPLIFGPNRTAALFKNVFWQFICKGQKQHRWRQDRQHRFTHRKNRNKNCPWHYHFYYLILRMLEITILRICFSLFCVNGSMFRDWPPKLQEVLHPLPLPPPPQQQLLPLSNSQANIYWMNTLLGNYPE